MSHFWENRLFQRNHMLRSDPTATSGPVPVQPAGRRTASPTGSKIAFLEPIHAKLMLLRTPLSPARSIRRSSAAHSAARVRRRCISQTGRASTRVLILLLPLLDCGPAPLRTSRGGLWVRPREPHPLAFIPLPQPFRESRSDGSRPADPWAAAVHRIMVG
jgi:hypothetical protein